MADYSPTWEEIAGQWRDVLGQALGYTVYYPYPDNAVDAFELPCVVINEPTGFSANPFTFGAVTASYTGRVTLLVLAVETEQATLSSMDNNKILAAGLTFCLAVHANQKLKSYWTHVSLGEGEIGRISPYDPDMRGNYAGMIIPYTIQMQYRS